MNIFPQQVDFHSLLLIHNVAFHSLSYNLSGQTHHSWRLDSLLGMELGSESVRGVKLKWI